ncbi:hypothetical protein CARUB_v10012646mg, partial [Capsella rubella]
MKREDEDEKETKPSELLDSLPIELKMDILTRLPAKSLMKFRYVSKMWSSFIRSQELINSFSSKSSTQTRFILALSNDGNFSEPEGNLSFYFSFSDDAEESSCLVPNLEMAMPVISNHISGSCTSVHGILAVIHSFQLILCNPSTEQVIKLTPGYAGFVGYDPINDQHKVLSLLNQFSDDPVEHKVLTLGVGGGWRRIQGLNQFYTAVSMGVCINGFVFYGAYSPTPPSNPGIVCFDVRFERLSYIKAPEILVHYGNASIFIEYKGKLASIVRDPFGYFNEFDLWILEDVERHNWSKQTCVFPFSVWDSLGVMKMCIPGTNKADEIIMAPKSLSHKVQPFYIFYYNVETRNIRRVRLLGIGDNEEFRTCYELNYRSNVNIATHHFE